MDCFTEFSVSQGDGIGEKLILAPKVLVKTTDGEPRCSHHAGDARAAQPLGTKLASGVPHDTLAGAIFMVCFVTHAVLIGLWTKSYSRHNWRQNSVLWRGRLRGDQQDSMKQVTFSVRVSAPRRRSSLGPGGLLQDCEEATIRI